MPIDAIDRINRHRLILLVLMLTVSIDLASIDAIISVNTNSLNSIETISINTNSINRFGVDWCSKMVNMLQDEPACSEPLQVRYGRVKVFR